MANLNTDDVAAIRRAVRGGRKWFLAGARPKAGKKRPISHRAGRRAVLPPAVGGGTGRISSTQGSDHLGRPPVFGLALGSSMPPLRGSHRRHVENA